MGLPEKTILTLDEVVSRWRYWGCDHATLHGYAQQDQLVFSVYLRDIGSHKSIWTEAGSQITRKVQTITFVSPDAVIRRLFYLDGNDSRRIMEAKDNEQVAVNALYWTTERTNKRGTYHASAMYLTRQDLVVTREECDRFERRHGAIGFRGLLKRVAFWIKEPSEHKTLTLVGSAVMALVTAMWAAFKWYHQ